MTFCTDSSSRYPPVIEWQ